MSCDQRVGHTSFSDGREASDTKICLKGATQLLCLLAGSAWLCGHGQVTRGGCAQHARGHRHARARLARRPPSSPQLAILRRLRRDTILVTLGDCAGTPHLVVHVFQRVTWPEDQVRLLLPHSTVVCGVWFNAWLARADWCEERRHRTARGPCLAALAVRLEAHLVQKPHACLANQAYAFLTCSTHKSRALGSCSAEISPSSWSRR